MTIRRVLAVVSTAALLLPATVSASHLNMSVEVVGPGDLVAGVQVLLPVEVSCDPFEPSPFGGSFASVQITLTTRGLSRMRDGALPATADRIREVLVGPHTDYADCVMKSSTTSSKRRTPIGFVR